MKSAKSGAGDNEQQSILRLYSWMGICLLFIQLAERALQQAIATVLDDPIVRLSEQSEAERKQTLGDFLKKLKKRVRLEYALKERLYDFLRMRNQFVHDLSDWDLKTAEGRRDAQLFVIELTMLALSTTALFTTVFQVWARDNFDEEFFNEVEGEQRQLLKMFESQFGGTARKILAGKHSKPAQLRTGK